VGLGGTVYAPLLPLGDGTGSMAAMVANSSTPATLAPNIASLFTLVS